MLNRDLIIGKQWLRRYGRMEWQLEVFDGITTACCILEILCECLMNSGYSIVFMMNQADVTTKLLC